MVGSTNPSSCRDFQNFSLSRGLLENPGGTAPAPGPSQASDARRSLCDFGPEDGDRRASALEFWGSRAASSGCAINSAAAAAALPGTSAEGVPESPRQPPDSPVTGGDVRRKVAPPPPEDGEGPGEGGKAEGAGRKKGMLEERLFLSRKRAPAIPHLSSVSSSTAGSDGGGSDSSATASPSPTRLGSATSPRHKKLSSEASNQDSSL